MEPVLPGGLPSRPRRLRRGLSDTATELVGASVSVAVPMQRHHPGLVLGLCVAELAALAAVMATGDLAAFALLAVLALLLLVAAATNRRQVLAVTSMGTVQLTASLRGRPKAVAGPAPSALELPEPRGLGGRVEIAGTVWWIDRANFPRLARAREALATGGESPGSGS